MTNLADFKDFTAFDVPNVFAISIMDPLVSLNPGVSIK